MGIFQHKQRAGFTIVELLIVVVVIAILAAITIVVYNGVIQRATISSMQSDLQSDRTVLENDKTITGVYPTTAAAANNGLGLKSSGNNQITYYTATDAFCVLVTNSATPTTYRVSNSDGQVSSGSCAPWVSTLAGSGVAGFADGTGVAAKFNYPTGVALDSTGNIYVADGNTPRIRKITSAGAVSTFAGASLGYANGTGTAAKFSYPQGVAIDATDNVYVADYGNNSIRKITPAGAVTTLAGSGAQTGSFADGTGAAAQFNGPMGVAVDASGTVYVADYFNHRIRKITSGGVVTTLAGSTQGFADGTGVAAQFNYPYGVAVDTSGTVYVADMSNYRIRAITPTGVVSTLAGTSPAGTNFADGTGSAAKFSSPSGIALDPAGNIYVGDAGNGRIRKILPGGIVTTLVGTDGFSFADGLGATAQFNFPRGVALDPSGNVYVADQFGQRIRKITTQ